MRLLNDHEILVTDTELERLIAETADGIAERFETDICDPLVTAAHALAGALGAGDDET